jgi:fructokinase
MKKFVTIGLGELLWDVFPDSRQLGGAPANFAYMTSLLGDEGVVASRVGADALGEEAKRRLENIGLGASSIQIDPMHRTGVVQVEVDGKGQPTFEIAAPVAWDFFEWTPEWQGLAQKADAVCFGSLAQRCVQSRETIRAFLRAVRVGTTRVFDVNLRQSFYTGEVLADSAEQADIIKLNHDELPAVVQLLGFPYEDEEAAAGRLLKMFHVKLICVTRGAGGSLLVGAKGKDEHAGVRTQVADTVGSGDAFTAALVYHHLRGNTLAAMNEAANLMGSWVASQTGATPKGDEERLELIRNVR